MTSLRRAEAEAFVAAAFDAHARSIYGYCFRRTGDRERAADLLSMTFLEAWRRRDADVPELRVLPWLYGIATNLIRNEARSRRRYSAALARLPAPTCEVDFANDLTERVHSAEQMREIAAALRRLPRGERDAFTLCAWQGLSTAEAAYAVGVSENAMRARLSRARRRLARLLDGERLISSSASLDGRRA